MVVELADRAFAVRYDDPGEMLALAQLAVDLAHGTSQEAQAYACAHLGNALRVNGLFVASHAALDRADALYGSNQPLVLLFRASLHQDRREFEPAMTCLSRASLLTAEPEKRAQLILQTANVLDLTGHHLQAAELAKSALDALVDPLNVASAIQGIALYLSNAGQPGRALQVLISGEDLFSTLGPLAKLRVAWLEGKLAIAVGAYAHAVTKLGLARDGFACQSMPQETALISIDISFANAQQGHLGRARRELQGVSDLLEAMGIGTDAVAARLLQEALQAKTRETFVASALALAREVAGLPRSRQCGRPAPP